MKETILFLFVFFSMAALQAQEVSLFDHEGDAVAYIDFDEDATIYLWQGDPVAFLQKEGSDMAVFGFNGNFLGWYEEGVMYDNCGHIVGAKEGAVVMITRIEGVKGIRGFTPSRPITAFVPFQPILQFFWSDTSLTDFLTGRN